MAAEDRYRAVIEVGLQTRDAVSAAERLQRDLQAILSRVADAPTNRLFDPSQLGREVEATLVGAFERAYRSSRVFQEMGQRAQGVTGAAFPLDAGSKQLDLQLRLAQAELARARFDVRRTVPYGEPGGFRDSIAERSADVNTAKALNAANLALTKYRQEQVDQARKDLAASSQAQGGTGDSLALARQLGSQLGFQRRINTSLEQRAATEERANIEAARQLGQQLRLGTRLDNAQARKEAEAAAAPLNLARDLGKDLRFGQRLDLAQQRKDAAEAAAPLALARNLGSQLGYQLRLDNAGKRRAAAEERQADIEANAWRGLARGLGQELTFGNRITKALQARATAEERAAARSQRDFLTNFAAQYRLNARLQRAQEGQAAAAEREARKAGLESARQLGLQLRQAGADSYSFTGSQDPEQARNFRERALMGSVNIAERNFEAATRRLAEEREKSTRTAATVAAAEANLARAEQTLAQRRETLSTYQQGQQQGNLRSQFLAGFRGASDRPYAEQIGQAFKFSVFYGTAYKLLFGITQTFQQTLQEGIAFQQAMSELRIASGKSGDELNKISENLGTISAQAGFAASDGVLVGARSLGLYGQTEASTATQQQVAETTARVVGRLAFTSGQQPQDIQTNIAAITNAFGGGYQAQTRVADLDAYFSQKFGIAPGGSLQAVAESGTLGQSAGFNEEQVTAIAAALMARTGQTASAVSGFMAQIFSRGGEGSLQDVAQKYGVDTTQTLAGQVAQLSEIYRNASPNQQTEIAASFGRGRVQGAAQVLLQSFADISKAADKATTDAQGAADKSFTQRIGNIGGELQVLQATFKEFANQLGQTGILDLLGGAAEGLKLLTESATEILSVFNELPRPVRDAIVGIGLLAAASRLAAETQTVASARSAVAGAFGSATGVGGRLAAGAGLTRAALTSPLGATAVVAGLTIASGELIKAARNLDSASGRTRNLLTNPDELLSSSASTNEILGRASALRDAAAQQREASGGLARIYGLGSKREEALAAAGTAESEATRLEALARAITEQAGRADASRQLVSGFDTDSITQSFDFITQAGGTAADQFNALAAAVNGSGDAARRAANSFDPEVFAGQAAEELQRGLLKNSGVQFVENRPSNIGTALSFLNQGDLAKQLGLSDRVDVTAQTLQGFYSPDQIAKALGGALGDTKSLLGVGPGEASSIAEQAFAALPDIQDQVSPEIYAQIKASFTDQIRKYLLSRANGLRRALRGAGSISQSELTSIIAQLSTKSDEAAGDLSESDLTGRLTNARRLVDQIERAIAATRGGARDVDLQALGKARNRLAAAEFAKLEAERRVAQQNATSASQVASVGRSFLNREISSAVRNRSGDQLAAIIGQAGRGAIAIARQSIQRALATARAAYATELANARAARSLLAGVNKLLPFGGGLTLPGLPKGNDVRDLQSMLDSLSQQVYQPKDSDVYTVGDATALGGKGTKADDQPKETAAERNAARLAALAQRSESQIDSARADLASARAAMAKAKKGTVEYYSALGQYYSAQNALTDAIQAYANNRYLLARDTTDPLVQARAAVVAAQRKLRSDRGKGADVLAQDRLDLRNAQANAEQTAFQQRLEAVQTADQLGRISHQKYLAYLQHEHDRLEGIKNRTYQQQQQLNQIDQLMQEAAKSMSGMWNFGDIQLPTPYQVRRYVEAQTKGPGGQAMTEARMQGPYTVINIDGTDVRMVRDILEQHVGGYQRTSTTSSRRR